jgi:hypothetical protein
MGPRDGAEQRHRPYPMVPGQAWPPREIEGTAVAGLATAVVALVAMAGWTLLLLVAAI